MEVMDRRKKKKMKRKFTTDDKVYFFGQKAEAITAHNDWLLICFCYEKKTLYSHHMITIEEKCRQPRLILGPEYVTLSRQKTDQ